jgi:hypothetical protein
MRFLSKWTAISVPGVTALAIGGTGRRVFRAAMVARRTEVHGRHAAAG